MRCWFDWEDGDAQGMGDRLGPFAYEVLPYGGESRSLRARSGITDGATGGFMHPWLFSRLRLTIQGCCVDNLEDALKVLSYCTLGEWRAKDQVFEEPFIIHDSLFEKKKKKKLNAHQIILYLLLSNFFPRVTKRCQSNVTLPRI